MNFCQWLESEIRYYPAAGVHYYQYTLRYPGIFSVLKSYTVVKYSEWYLNIRLTHEPWGGWKSNFCSPVATLFQKLETNLIPGLLHVASPNSLMAAELCDQHPPEYTPAPLLALQLWRSLPPHGRQTPGLSWLRVLSPLVIIGASWSWWWLPAI